MALYLGVVPDRPNYFPGEVVSATAEIFNPPTSNSPVAVVELTVEVVSTEIIDPAYVSTSYHRGVPGAPVKNSRRVTRDIFRTPAVRLVESCSLPPGARRLFTLSFTLPGRLPPSFRGTSVRFDHAILAEAKYVVKAPEPGATGGSGSNPLQKTGSFTSVDSAWPGGQLQAIGSVSGGQLSSQVSGVSEIMPDQPALESGADGGDKTGRSGPAVLQSTLLKVPVHVWPTEAADRMQAGGLFVAGEEAEAATPSVSFRLGCAGSDLRLYAKEIGSGSLAEGLLAPEAAAAAVTGARAGAGLPPLPAGAGGGAGQQRASDRGAAAVRGGRAAAARRAAASTSSDEDDEEAQGAGGGGLGNNEEEDAGDASSPGPTPTGEMARKLSRWSTVEANAVALRNSPLTKVFNIRLGDAPLVRLSLHPPLEGSLQPGGTVMGTLDFRASQRAHAADMTMPKCLMVVITLETEEVLADEYLLPVRSGIIHKIFDEQVELTPDTCASQFSFSIPRDACPSFALPLLTLRWLLRFEFNVGAESGGWTRSQEQSQLVWPLPILVRPPA